MRKQQQAQEKQAQTGEDLMSSLLGKAHVPQSAPAAIGADKPEIKRVVRVWCDRQHTKKWVLECDDGSEVRTENAVIRAATFSCKKIGTTNHGCGISDIYRGYATGTWNPLEKADSKGKQLAFHPSSGKFFHKDKKTLDYIELDNVGILKLLKDCSSRFSTINPKKSPKQS